MAAKDSAKQLRELYVSEADRKTLLSLESVLVASYLRLFDQIDVHETPGRRWQEIRKVEKLRIYEQRSPGLPSIMMLGTIVGSLDDVMYGVVAATDRDESVKQKVLRDGSEQSKVLSCLVEPTEHDPFRQVSVKWQQYSTRDYVCLDTTGFAGSLSSGRVGYSLSHSVAFGNQVPHFDRHSIDRSDRSICVFYRQSAPNTVECCARGFFDLGTEGDSVFTSVAMQVVANQWLSHTRITTLSRMKKITCRLNQQLACVEMKANRVLTTRSSCTVCSKQIGRLGSVKHCNICTDAICPRCCVKLPVCVFDTQIESVVETIKAFCVRCIQEVSQSNTVAIARQAIPSNADNNLAP